MKLSVRARMALAFAAVVACALLLFGGAAVAVLLLEIRRDEAEMNPGAAEPDEDDVRSLWQALEAMAITAPLAIGGAAVVGTLLSKRALAPMREAMERVQRFTADAAHELRTPLTSIIGEADVALRRERSAEELRASLERIRGDAARMSELAAALLTLARADAGALLPARSEVELGALADELAGRHQGTRAVHEAAPLLVAGDRTLLSQAIDNLLANAARHGASPVEVSVLAQNGSVLVRVTDQGRGFAPALAARAFERFARGDDARAGDGFGLGLSIAQAIARAHGGTLELVPVPRGACLELALPALPARK